jgi:hypothetical protein
VAKHASLDAGRQCGTTLLAGPGTPQPMNEGAAMRSGPILCVLPSLVLSRAGWNDRNATLTQAAPDPEV